MKQSFSHFLSLKQIFIFCFSNCYCIISWSSSLWLSTLSFLLDLISFSANKENIQIESGQWIKHSHFGFLQNHYKKSCSADVEGEGSLSLSFNCCLGQLALLSSGSFPSLPFPHLAACWLVLESLYCWVSWSSSLSWNPQSLCSGSRSHRWGFLD